MFLSNPARSVVAGPILLIITAGCGIFHTTDNSKTRSIEEPKRRIPFSTVEPENFQCEIVETAGPVVRRKRLAKMGLWRRVDLDYGEPGQRALLQTDKEYIIDVGGRRYAETETGQGGRFSDLTHELLSRGQYSEFEETKSDGNSVVYTVRPENGGSSEIVVHYDKLIGLPVKQEFYSLAGAERTLAFTIEIVNFVNQPSQDAFIIPEEFKKVPLEELTGVPK